MDYSLALLTTRAQCDAAIAAATELRKVLVFRDQETDYRADNTTTSAKSLSAELKSLNTYIAATTPALADLESGSKEYNETADELRTKTDRRDALLARQRKEGAERLVIRELQQALLEPQLPIIDAFIAAVTAHRATLSA